MSDQSAQAALGDARLPAIHGDWTATQQALHLRTQIVGKTRLALEPVQNHWWHSALYVTARGLSTSVMPYAGGHLEIEIDLVDHDVAIRTNTGATRTLPIQTESIAEFYHNYCAALESLDVEVRLWPQTVEIAQPIRFPDDHRELLYDRDQAGEFFQVLLHVDRLLKTFRSRFLGKCSPSHFWWGSFDHACTRFSGRRAPRHPGGIPNLADTVTREAYSHECISAGWWPGTPGGAVQEAAFYAYSYPEPPGLAEAPVRPAAARYDATLHEWILPHDAACASDDPDGCVLEFLQHTYDTASRLASWSRDLVRADSAA